MAADPDYMFDERVPSGGVYADDVRVWHARHEFTVDLMTHWLNPRHHTESQVIVARLKIPSTAMFDIVRRLSSGIGEYEAEHGRLTPPPTEAS